MAKTRIDVNNDMIQSLYSHPQRMREVIQVICQAAMSQEVGEHVGAQLHERTDGRRGHRNGSKPRTLLTRVGELELSVPQVRDCDRGPYHPSLFARWERSERALLVACGEMYFQHCCTTRSFTMAPLFDSILAIIMGVLLGAFVVGTIVREVHRELQRHRPRPRSPRGFPVLPRAARK